MINEFLYPGAELEIFARAVNWKNYWSYILKKHVRGHVAEVGAGIGGSTSVLMSSAVESWCFIEPDPNMAKGLQATQPVCLAGLPVRVHHGTLSDLPPEVLFDTLVYIDVLEHIENDHAEVMQAIRRLNPGGRLIVLSPAFQCLFSPFDAAVGHYRRYTLSSLRCLADGESSIVEFGYLDCLGMLLSLGNRIIMRQSKPAMSQIVAWDKWIVPLSRHFLDPIARRFFGRSVYIVWEK